MKKQTLLGAIALTTLVVGAAGAANAQQYTVVSKANAGATVSAPVKVATEVKLTGTTSKGIVGLAVTPSASAILPGGNSVLTFTLTGGHTFGTDVTPGAILQGANCKPTTTISSGGLAASSSVSFLISGLGGCNNGNPILANLPAALANQTTALGVDTTFKTELGTDIDGGKASISKLVQFAPAFSVAVVADTVLTQALLADFKTLTTNVDLGTIAIVADTAVAKGIDDVTQVAAQSDITSAGLKFVGSQSANAVSLKYGATAVPVNGLLTVATPANTVTTVTAVAGGVDAIPASTYTVAVDLTLKAAYNAQPTFGPSSLQSILREGTTYLIPWVSSGTLAGATGNSTVVRIANISTAASSGAVSAELLTSSAGVPASKGLVPLSSGIAKGGELVITGQSLQTAIGADFGRGDIRITVEADPATLITRRFIQNVANGSLTEVSLGRTLQGGTAAEPIN